MLSGYLRTTGSSSDSDACPTHGRAANRNTVDAGRHHTDPGDADTVSLSLSLLSRALRQLRLAPMNHKPSFSATRREARLVRSVL